MVLALCFLIILIVLIWGLESNEFDKFGLFNSQYTPYATKFHQRISRGAVRITMSDYGGGDDEGGVLE